MEAGRHDQGVVGRHELRKARTHAHVLEQPADDLLERRLDGLHLARDDFPQRQPATDLGLHRTEELEVAEALDHEVQRVGLGHGAVPVQDEGVGHGANW